MTSRLALDRLSFAYDGGVPVLREVTVAVEPGEVVAVVGPSGSGKSTLLRLVSGLLRPLSGDVVVDGANVTARPPEDRPVAMVFQGYGLFPHLDVAANIGFGLRARGVARSERGARVLEVGERLGLTALLDRRPGELSGGERQRVALARALLRDPVVFCLDEPLSSLDPVLRVSARRQLDEVLRADGRCALHVTHDQSEAMTLGDRVAVLHDGRLVQVGTPQDLYRRPATTFVASFVGSPPMSLIPAGLSGLPGRHGVATLGVHAEDVALVPGDDGVVVAVDDLGHEQLAEVRLDGGTVLVRLNGSEVRRGDRTGIVLHRWYGFDADGTAVP